MHVHIHLPKRRARDRAGDEPERLRRALETTRYKRRHAATSREKIDLDEEILKLERQLKASTNDATTAQLRTQAREAEERLEWSKAAELWEAAIAAYPTKVGQLAERDIQQMKQHLNNAKHAMSHDEERCHCKDR